MLADKSEASMKVFISYDQEDYAIAKKLYDNLKNNSEITIWMDRENILSSQNWELEIDRAIKNNEFFLFLLSSNSLKKIGAIRKDIKSTLKRLEDLTSDEKFIFDNCELTCEELQNIKSAEILHSYENSLKEILRVLSSDKKTEDRSKKIKFSLIFLTILITCCITFAVTYKSTWLTLRNHTPESEVIVRNDSKQVNIEEPQEMDKSACSHYWICFLDDVKEVVWPKIQVQNIEEFDEIISKTSIPRSFKSGRIVLVCTNNTGSDYFNEWLRIDEVGDPCRKPDNFSILDEKSVSAP